MSAAATSRRYAARRVNPFVGAQHILETSAGRALTVNGLVWELTLPVSVPSSKWGALNRDRHEWLNLRYGLWSESDGMVRYPYQSGFDRISAQRQARELVAAVREASSHLPFPFRDRRELWLLDQHTGLPIALLTSIAAQNPSPSPLPKQWKACLGQGTPGQRCFPHAERLEGLVRRRAGFNLDWRWVERQDDGSGIAQPGGELLDAELFPPFLLTQDWSAPEERQLANDFIAWTAPALLTLQQLSTSNRERLESQLQVQAQSIEHHWRLYPQVVNDDLIKAARVQCRLINASRRSTHLTDEAIPE